MERYFVLSFDTYGAIRDALEASDVRDELGKDHRSGPRGGLLIPASMRDVFEHAVQDAGKRCAESWPRLKNFATRIVAELGVSDLLVLENDMADAVLFSTDKPEVADDLRQRFDRYPYKLNEPSRSEYMAYRRDWRDGGSRPLPLLGR